MTESQVPAWIDALAEQLIDTTGALRRAVRRHHYDPPPPGQTVCTDRGRWGRGITVAVNEARTLLRGAMPVPIAVSNRRRGAHARLSAALGAFAGQLLQLNDSIPAGPVGVSAAIDLREQLDAWISAARWHQATSRTGTAWPAPPKKGDVRALMRQSTQPAVLDLFDPPAPAARKRAVARGSATAESTTQLPLLLPLPGRPMTGDSPPRSPAPPAPTLRAVSRRAGHPPDPPERSATPSGDATGAADGRSHTRGRNRA